MPTFSCIAFFLTISLLVCLYNNLVVESEHLITELYNVLTISWVQVEDKLPNKIRKLKSNPSNA